MGGRVGSEIQEVRRAEPRSEAMPIYEYRCRHCSTRFEKLLRRTGEEIACPSCEGHGVDRLISAFAVLSATPTRTPMEACAAGSCGSGACGGGGCALAE